jgi:hypothetical protein
MAASTGGRGLYLAFNRATGKDYHERLSSARIPAMQTARPPAGVDGLAAAGGSETRRAGSG